MPEEKRRATDLKASIDAQRKQDELDELIKEEDDPKQRVFLVVLNNINKSLVENTATTRDIANQLDEHITEFKAHISRDEAMLNKARGAWKVIAWVVGIAQLIILAFLAVDQDERQEVRAFMLADKLEHLHLSNRLDVHMAKERENLDGH